MLFFEFLKKFLSVVAPMKKGLSDHGTIGLGRRRGKRDYPTIGPWDWGGGMEQWSGMGKGADARPKRLARSVLLMFLPVGHIRFSVVRVETAFIVPERPINRKECRF
jgi:hypothetical protein